MTRKAVFYYGVRVGRNTGVYRDWDECNEQVYGYRGGSCKKFKSLKEANEFAGNPPNLPYESSRRARLRRKQALNARLRLQVTAGSQVTAESQVPAGSQLPAGSGAAESELSEEPGLAMDTSSDSQDDTAGSVLDDNDIFDEADSLSDVTAPSEIVYDDLQSAKNQLSLVMRARGAVKIVPVSPSHE